MRRDGVVSAPVNQPSSSGPPASPSRLVPRHDRHGGHHRRPPWSLPPPPCKRPWRPPQAWPQALPSPGRSGPFRPSLSVRSLWSCCWRMCTRSLLHVLGMTAGPGTPRLVPRRLSEKMCTGGSSTPPERWRDNRLFNGWEPDGAAGRPRGCRRTDLGSRLTRWRANRAPQRRNSDDQRWHGRDAADGFRPE
jgi:hypothetical protein